MSKNNSLFDIINYDNNDMFYILIDLSYMIFYRYYALCRWWKLARPDNKLENDINNEEFKNKFLNIFSKIKETILKNLKINKIKNYKFICAKDCHRQNIWRKTLFNNYKQNRENNDYLFISKFFEEIYKEGFLKSIGFDIILEYDSLEADDIIAITKNFIRKKYPIINNNSKEKSKETLDVKSKETLDVKSKETLNTNILIIANDKDYLQLIDSKTVLINLAYKIVSNDSKLYENSKKNLLSKILLGDKSDCIPSVFPKLTKKKLDLYLDNNDLLQNDLIKNKLIEKFNFNLKLIDFDYIPKNLINGFIEKYKLLFNVI